jgi:hypothetical protein
LQLDAFDGAYNENLYEVMVSVAYDNFRYSGFYISDIRKSMADHPSGRNAHRSWIGTGVRKLISKGWKQTNERRASPIRSNNGRKEYRYVYEGGFGTEIV